MGLITVDADKCKRDGICMEECPMAIIKIEEPEAFPSLVPHGEALCINCGHCVTVCPHGALGLETMTPEACDAVRRDLLPTPEQVEHLLRSRRSIHSYSEKAVPREVLTRLLDIARYAPSTHNDQTVHWIVIEDKDELKKFGSMMIGYPKYKFPRIPLRNDLRVTWR